MASATRSANIAELKRMFSNLDSNVIESVLIANNGQVDLTIDHLLTMSIDTETTNNIHQSLPTTPLRQLPVIANLYEDDPPPYPGLENNPSPRAVVMPSLPHRSSMLYQSSSASSNSSDYSQLGIQVQRWKTSYGQYRTCYTGDLPDDFLRVKMSCDSKISNAQSNIEKTNNSKNHSSPYLEDEHLALLLQNEEFVNELRHNKEFLSTLRSDTKTLPIPPSTQRRSSNQFSTKPLPLPMAPTVEVPKTPKIQAKMLHNVLTQIEQGQTIRTSMVPEQSITEHESYTYGKDDKYKVPLPPAPLISESDPSRMESNDELIVRLKHMGKNSMEKFQQLARRFSMRKGATPSDLIKNPKSSIIFNRADRQRLTNEFDSDDDHLSMNPNNSNRSLTSV